MKFNVIRKRFVNWDPPLKKKFQWHITEYRSNILTSVSAARIITELFTYLLTYLLTYSMVQNII
jgi:hypothetical protein